MEIALRFENSISDIGDIIGLKLRLDYKPSFLSQKPKWNVHSLSAEVCRKLIINENNEPEG